MGPSWWATGAGVGAGWLLGASTAAFVNPYYVAPAVGSTVVYNYEQPIQQAQPIYVDTAPTNVIVQPAESPAALPVPTDAPQATYSEKVPEQPQPEDPKLKEAGIKFEAARDAFKSKEFDVAQRAIEKAIQVMPNDPVLHEFRGLTLFAQQKFKDAAGVIYSVLAGGPGMNWDTMKSLYKDPATYEQQVKDLVAYVKANPQDAASRFLLAYHMLVIDERETAIKLLDKVVELQPEDKLSAEIAKALRQSLATPADKPKIEP